MTGKRRISLVAGALLLALLAIVAAGCGTKKEASSGSTDTGTNASASCSKADLNLVKSGVLTVGTGNPAYPPWYGGTPHKPWQVSDPRSGKGYESAVAYAVAKGLGFSKDEVDWKYVPFNTSFAPGPKSFDFDINQVAVTPERSKTVDFSRSYYDENQAVVVLKGTPIAKVTTLAALRPYELGAQLGTTSYQFIQDVIKPSKKPSVFPQNAGAVQALKNGQIDGLVLDLPTAFYVSSAQVPNGEILGQFPTQPGGEHFGLVFQKGNSLRACVDKVLTTLDTNGTLKRLQQQWIQKAGAPILK